MRRRGLCVALAIFEAIWLNVIVPGHRRGIVQMPGASAAAACPFCCCCQQPTTPSSDRDGPKQNSPTGPAGTCAICNFAAHLSVPPVIDFTPPPLKLLGPVEAEIARRAIARITLIPFDGRGPPAIA
jgi:hypothetical protein